jgi:uncharacterized protein (TIGR03435 family)
MESSMVRPVLSIVIIATLLGVRDVRAQAAFEAAVVKRSDLRAQTAVVPGMPLPGGRWSAQRATLATIIRSTYGFAPNRIVGLPDWASTVRYDILAKAKTNVASSELQNMAKQLLAERFGLKVRIDPRIGTVYAMLRVNQLDLPPGLRQSSCDANKEMREQTTRSTTGEVNPCGTEFISRLDNGALRYQMRGRPLINLLTFTGAREEIGSPIVDRTELQGTFDIDLTFQSISIHIDSPSAAPSLVTAMAEQLGLKFERRTETVEFLIVEAIHRPKLD